MPGAGGGNKDKSKGQDKNKGQGTGLKGKLPFFGGKGGKDKSGDRPARPAGLPDRDASARSSTALPGAASGRPGVPSSLGPSRSESPQGRPSTASRARAQAKALPDARQAPRIVNRGLDLDRKLDLIGVALVVLGGIMLFGILPSMSFGLLPPVEGGLTGTINRFLSQLFGWGKVAWPVLCFGIGIWLMLRYFGGQMFDIDYFRVVGALVLYGGALAWLHMLQLVNDAAPTVEAFKPISYDLAVKAGEGGGWFGHQIYFFLLSQLGDWGTLVLLIGWLVLGIMLTFNVSAIQIGQFAVSAVVFLRTRGDRTQRRVAREVAQAESVAVARPGAPQAALASSRPRQIPLPPAAVTGAGAGQAPGGSGSPTTASQEQPERPRPLIRRRGDEETNPSVDMLAPSAETPVLATAPGEKTPEAASSRFRLPSLRGGSASRDERAPDDEKRPVPAGDEKSEQGGGSRFGRLGSVMKRRGSDSADETPDDAKKATPENGERSSRPSIARPLAAAAVAGAALAFDQLDRRTDQDALGVTDLDDEADEVETGEEVEAAGGTAPARSPFAPPRTPSSPRSGMGPSPLQHAVFDDEDDDEDDVDEIDEIEQDDEDVNAPGALTRTAPAAAGEMPGLRSLPGSAPAQSAVPAGPGDGEEPDPEPYRPFSRPLPGRRIPPFDPSRGTGTPERSEESAAARLTPRDEVSAPASDDQPPVRDRARALGLPPRPGMAPRRMSPIIETPMDETDADASEEEDTAPARPDLSGEPPGRGNSFATAAAPADADGDETARAKADPSDLDEVDLDDDEDEVTTPVEEPRARPAFLTGDARPQGMISRRPMPGSVAPVRAPIPARPGSDATVPPGEEDDEHTASAALVGSNMPLERRFPRAPLRSDISPVTGEPGTNGSGDDSMETPDQAGSQVEAPVELPTVRATVETPAVTNDTTPAEAEAVTPLDDEPDEALAPVPARSQAAAQVQPPRAPNRPLPTERPAPSRREDVASIASAAAAAGTAAVQAARDLTRRDAVSLGALKDKDEGQPAPARSGSQKLRWEMPDFRNLLKEGREQRVDDEVLLDKARMIEDTLESFGAPGKVVEVNPGPVITQFGVEPDYLVNRSGKRTRVKVSSIARLDADLALALAARSIRVEAPVPGKGFVGIEVPNDEISAVNLRDVMDSPEFRRINSKLRIALGLSVDGTPVAADLTAMPHLLIAGTTGSGKSVCVNAIINCLLLTNSPEELQFIMVDPKRVELTGYNGIPHLLSPVVVDLERIVGVLQWVQREMDDRYRRFAAIGARNIVDYNGKLRADEKRMPYIIVVIDELADLMMLAPDETEKLLARLAQMARATGIHLIISTQRPSVDVVTGLIKANFPARIAFAVASMMDSRVILDQPGAEKLLGRGDMLYQSPDAAAPLRMQGVYVSDEEINTATRYWKTQGLNKSSAAQDDDLVSFPKTNGHGRSASRPAMRGEPGQQQAFWDDSDRPNFDVESDDGGDGRDEMYDEAVELVKRLNKASISLLQRRLRIGYTRAARLIDIMENEGIVGPSESGSKPREVLRRD